MNKVTVNCYNSTKLTINLEDQESGYVELEFKNQEDSILEEVTLINIDTINLLNHPPKTIKRLHIYSSDGVLVRFWNYFRELFPNLERLMLCNLETKYLPPLPESVLCLSAIECGLETLGELPPNLRILDVSENYIDEALDFPPSLGLLNISRNPIEFLTIRTHIGSVIADGTGEINLLGKVESLTLDYICEDDFVLKMNYPENLEKLRTEPSFFKLVNYDFPNLKDLTIWTGMSGKDSVAIDLTKYTNLINLTMNDDISAIKPDSLLYFNGSSVKGRESNHKTLPIIGGGFRNTMAIVQQGLDIEFGPGYTELVIDCSKQEHFECTLNPSFKGTLKFYAMDRSILKSVTIKGDVRIPVPSYGPEGVVFTGLMNPEEWKDS